MLGLSEWNDQLLSRVRAQNSDSSSQWLQALRLDHINAFIQQGLPTRKREDWHYTDVSAISNYPLTLVQAPEAYLNDEPLKQMMVSADRETESHLLVFVDGHFNSALSKIQALPQGVVLTNLASILKEQPDLVKPYLTQFAQESSQKPFACLNTAMILDGLFLCVPDKVQMKQPVHILCLSSCRQSDGNMTHLRHIIVTGQNSCLSLFEEYQSIIQESRSEDFYLNTVVTQIYAGKAAVINHYKLQNENSATYHIGHITAKQEQDSCIHLYNFSLGSRLVRDELQVDLHTPGTHCQLNGLYLLTHQQHNDQHILVNHHSLGTSSEQLYRGVVAEEATAVFNGRVVVHEGAQKSKAKQSNQNLLLSKSATVNTKPEFEIYASDVQCAHGATVGYMDENARFYLRSRGLDEQAATNLLIDAFVSSVLKQITVRAIGDKISTVVQEKIQRLSSAKN